jgi:Tol biopolymer transport system component
MLAFASVARADSSRIVYASTKPDYEMEVWIAAEDGDPETQLTDYTYPDDHPSICPDGRKIVFDSYRQADPYTLDLVVMNSTGTSQTNITETEDINDFDPDCGPVTSDVFWIVFVRDEDGNLTTTDDNEICKIKSDGTGFEQLTDNDDDDTEPVWCGNDLIAFASDRGGNYEIYTMDGSGGNVTNVSDKGSENRTPACYIHPTSTRIAWAHQPALGNFNIWTMNSDGTDQFDLDTGSSDEMEPSWAPAGTQIIYTRFGSTLRKIYVKNADGTGSESLFKGDSQFNYDSPDWGAAVLP